MPSLIRRVTSFAARNAAFEKFVSVLESTNGRRPGLLRVLTYHRVDEPEARPWLDPVLISATPDSFREQMEYVAKHYTAVSITDVVAAIQGDDRNCLPPRAVLVTFDDAYCDFDEHAWPVLQRLGIPATLFVPTAYPDQPKRRFWWDDLHNALKNTSRRGELHLPFGAISLSANERSKNIIHLKQYFKTLHHAEMLAQVSKLCAGLGVEPGINSVLGWDALRSLSREGVALGAHTRTHPLMNRITLDEARNEVIGSISDLRREIGATLPIFAYPSGEFNREVVQLLREEEIALAFTTTRGINSLRQMNPLQIQRINVGGGTSLPILRAQLLSWMIHFNKLHSLTRA